VRRPPPHFVPPAPPAPEEEEHEEAPEEEPETEDEGELEEITLGSFGIRKRPGLQTLFYRTLRAAAWLVPRAQRPAPKLFARLQRWSSLGQPADFRRMLGAMAFLKIRPRDRWEFVSMLLYEADTLGRLHVRHHLPGRRPDCVCCGAVAADGWCHILGTTSPPCRAAQRWAASVGAWDPLTPWSEILLPSSPERIPLSVRFVSTINRMYRWRRFGGAAVPVGSRGRSTSNHFVIDDAGFRVAWDAGVR